MTFDNFERLLARGERVIYYPEGVRGIGKGFHRRYELQRFHTSFITLAATLSIVPDVPVAGMALILGIDRFMSECRSLTNFIGNAVATVVVARWEGALDKDALDAALNNKSVLPAAQPAIA